jgi:hypothetical protein
MNTEKKAIQVGNKFILEPKIESFESLAAKAINKIEERLGLPITDFSEGIKNRRN